MIRQLGLACLIVVVGACDKPSEDGSTDTKPGRKTDEQKPSDPPAQTVAPASLAVVTDDIVRTKSGLALLLLPEIGEGWTVVHKDGAGVMGVQVFRGSPTDFTGFVTIMFPPPSRAVQTPEQRHAAFAAMMTPGMPHMVASGPPASFELPGGLANSWSGTAEGGISERAWMAIVVDGSATASILVRAEASVFDPQLMPMAKSLLAGLRLGSKVPKLPDAKPTTALSGTWESLAGLDLDFLTFDPRGFVHQAGPGDPSWLDLDLCLALERSLRAYRFEADKIVLDAYPADGEKQAWTWTFARKGDALIIDGDEYRRIDDAPVKLLPGTWEFYQSTNTGNPFTGSTGIAIDEATYEFRRDGTYSYTGGFTFSHNELDATNPGTLDWSAAGYSGVAPAVGSWKVDGHALKLDDGRHTAVRTIYASKHAPTEVVYIGGQKFVKMK